jgi:hypothetical protein
MAISTLSKFTVPLANDQSSASQGLLMPKLQYRFRAIFLWEAITINLRDDVNNSVTKLVGEQIQKQFDFFEQSSAASGIDYKFTARIEMLDGGNGASAPNVLETFELFGAYVENVNYNTLAYNTSEPATITMQVRYDNAIQTPTGTGIGTAVARTIGTLSTGGGQ